MLRLSRLGFACGRSTFIDKLETVPEPTAKIFVKICLDGQFQSSIYAQVDTGAAWSVLDPGIAADFGFLDRPGQPTILSSRLGRCRGVLVRVPIRFLADDGDPFDTEGTFFVSPDWPEGLNFLGYSGLLDSIRFAVDAQANLFYFGPGI
jgi:hypothetical protein